MVTRESLEPFLAFRAIHIDESIRCEHHYIAPDDICFCFGEYESHCGSHPAPINKLIWNLKKSVAKRGAPEYVYKERAIIQVAAMLQELFFEGNREGFTLVPIPPSKARTDPLYDDRLLRALRAPGVNLDVRDALFFRETMRACHEYPAQEKRPSPDDLYRLLAIEASAFVLSPQPNIVLFDDLLTTGSHFKACQRLLKERFPDCTVSGLFIGRGNISTILMKRVGLVIPRISGSEFSEQNRLCRVNFSLFDAINNVSL